MVRSADLSTGYVCAAHHSLPAYRHFSEADVQKLVPALIRSLVTHMSGWLPHAASSADFLLLRWGYCSEPAVQHQIAESMLDLLEAVPELHDPWVCAIRAMEHLDYCGRTLDNLQRRRAFEVMTKLLQENSAFHRQERVLESLKLLWRADEDPTSDFKDAIVALKALFNKFRNRDAHSRPLSLACAVKKSGLSTGIQSDFVLCDVP